MKKILFLATFIFIGAIQNNLHAQAYIKVNPIALAWGSLNASYEKVLSDKNSYELGANLLFGSGYTGVGASAQYRFYISDSDAPKGLFIAPEVGATFGKYTVLGTGTSFTAFELGGLIGYQWLFSNEKFSFQIGVGPAYYTGSSSSGSDFRYSGILPTGTLSLGYKLN
jgi:hypothetical protein